jgi:hypothetical protein
MKKSLNYILLFALFFIISCKKDCQSFETYQVDFFIDHGEFQLVEPIFETVTEQMLAKEASFSNRTFKTVTEQVLAKDGYSVGKADYLKLYRKCILQTCQINNYLIINCLSFNILSR